MTQESRTRLTAAVCTALIAAALVILLMCGTMSFALDDTRTTFAEIVLEPEEYIEVAQDYPSSLVDGEDTALADDSQQQDNADGLDTGGVSDREVNTDAPAGNVTSPDPSPVKEEKREDPGSALRRQQEEEQRRQKAEAAADVAGAFGDKGRGTAAASTQRANGTDPHGTLHGTGTGKIGHGWGLPGFGRPVSNSTGTIIIEAQIDKDGHVTSVTHISSVTINGRAYRSTAPASTDANAIEACKADVRGRTFPRTGVNDGQGTTAYIVYNFQ